MRHLTLVTIRGVPQVPADEMAGYASFQTLANVCAIDALKRCWPKNEGQPLDVDGVKIFDFSDESVIELPSIEDPDIRALQSEYVRTFCVRNGVVAFVTPDNKKYVARESAEVLRVLITHRYREAEFSVPMSMNCIAFTRATGDVSIAHISSVSDVNLIMHGLEALGNKRIIEDRSRHNPWLVQQIRTDLDTALNYAS